MLGKPRFAKQADHPDKESFQLGITGKGSVNPQTNEGKRDHVINRTVVKWAHLKCRHTEKGVVRRWHNTGNFHTFIGKQHNWGTSLKFPSTCLQHGKQCLCLYGYNLSGITETKGDSSHNWYVVMDGYRLFRKDRAGEGVVL